MSPGRVWTIIVAGGTGLRYGARKQLEWLVDRRVIDWSYGVAKSVSDVVVTVKPSSDLASYPGDLVAIGGATRSASVRSGLEAIAKMGAEPRDLVLVHDAARPLATKELFLGVVDALNSGAVSVLPTLAVTESLKLVDGLRVVGSIDRAGFHTAQTPQGFNYETITLAHAKGEDATDDVALVEALGLETRRIEGDPNNFKLTHRFDLRVAELVLLDRRKGDGNQGEGHHER